jgi:hypothetical protein
LVVGRERLGAEGFDAEFEAGRTMTMETAIADALQNGS